MSPDALQKVWLSAHGNAATKAAASRWTREQVANALELEAPAWRASGVAGPPAEAPPDLPDGVDAPPSANSPGWAAWVFGHDRQGVLSRAELSARAQARKDGESVSPPENPSCATQARVAIHPDDVRQLRDRCLIDLGQEPSKRRLVFSLPATYAPTTSKSQMLADYAPDFFNAQRAAWSMLANCIVADYQDQVAGCFWDDDVGYMHRAVLYALAMLSAGSLDSQFGDPAVELFTALRKNINAGELPLYLSPLGSDGHGTILVNEDGEVGSADTSTTSWTSITFAEISLSPKHRLSAALADYFLWWAWRLHSYAATGATGADDAKATGIACARLALAECAQIGATIAHEWVHLQGYWPGHCRGTPPEDALAMSALDWLVDAILGGAFTWLVADIVGALVGSSDVQPYRCMHDTLHFGWLGRACTHFNLPLASSHWDATSSTSDKDDVKTMVE